MFSNTRIKLLKFKCIGKSKLGRKKCAAPWGILGKIDNDFQLENPCFLSRDNCQQICGWEPPSAETPLLKAAEYSCFCVKNYEADPKNPARCISRQNNHEFELIVHDGERLSVFLIQPEDLVSEVRTKSMYQKWCHSKFY